MVPGPNEFSVDAARGECGERLAARVCEATMPNLSLRPVIWTPPAGIVTEAPLVLVTVIDRCQYRQQLCTDGTGSGAKDSDGGTPVPVSGNKSASRGRCWRSAAARPAAVGRQVEQHLDGFLMSGQRHVVAGACEVEVVPVGPRQVTPPGDREVRRCRCS